MDVVVLDPAGRMRRCPIPTASSDAGAVFTVALVVPQPAVPDLGVADGGAPLFLGRIAPMGRVDGGVSDVMQEAGIDGGVLGVIEPDAPEQCAALHSISGAQAAVKLQERDDDGLLVVVPAEDERVDVVHRRDDPARRHRHGGLLERHAGPVPAVASAVLHRAVDVGVPERHNRSCRELPRCQEDIVAVRAVVNGPLGWPARQFPCCLSCRR